MSLPFTVNWMASSAKTEYRSATNSVVLQWNPAHCGIKGNERVDFLAKKGTTILQTTNNHLRISPGEGEGKGKLDISKSLSLFATQTITQVRSIKTKRFTQFKQYEDNKRGTRGRLWEAKRARRHFSQLSEFQRGLIIGMKTAGWSTRRVAGQVDRSECTVRNCWEQWTREATHGRKNGSGATRKTLRREDRRIVRQALVDPTVTRSTIRADVGVAIVPQTISSHLAEANLISKRSFRALPLTLEHRQLRLQWCRARSM
ncbi:transposable element Tc1 transposase [Trichonephila clavipes]|nr:transposable element Tc1 transposase [Trichonephila clavipes]